MPRVSRMHYFFTFSFPFRAREWQKNLNSTLTMVTPIILAPNGED